MASENVDIIYERRQGVEWNQEDTTVMLELYGANLENVGPMKRFRNKKDLWLFISNELDKRGYQRTALQCENRYKTVIKRKKKDDQHNSQTGNNPSQPSPFADQLEVVMAVDDTIDPPIRIGIGQTFVDHSYVSTASMISPEASSSSSSSTPFAINKRKRKNESMYEAFCAASEKKENERKKRHEEKMELLKKIYESS